MATRVLVSFLSRRGWQRIDNPTKADVVDPENAKSVFGTTKEEAERGMGALKQQFKLEGEVVSIEVKGGFIARVSNDLSVEKVLAMVAGK